MTGLQLVAMLVTWLPLAPPSVEGGQWRAIWDERPQSEQTYRNYLSISTENSLDQGGEQVSSVLPTAIFPPVPHSFSTKFYAYKTPWYVNPDTGQYFIMGTDDRGADVLARMIFGARISLTIGFVAVGLSMLIGIVLGAISGYFGGWIDLMIQRIVEVMMAFPTFHFSLGGRRHVGS